MKSAFSEFSYGFAITRELIEGETVTVAPVFPSLIQEGQAGGGWDVRIETEPAIPMFLQFKLSECLTTRSASEFNLLGVPYYRMHLRSAKISQQHHLLLDLENRGHMVFYCSPGFHTESEFNQAFVDKQIAERSSWIAPSEIGPLPDLGEHYVVFRQPVDDEFYICSTPRKVKCGMSLSDRKSQVARKFEGRTPEDAIGQLNGMLRDFVYILERNGLRHSSWFYALAEMGLVNLPISEVASTASFLAQAIFGSQLYMMFQSKK